MIRIFEMKEEISTAFAKCKNAVERRRVLHKYRTLFSWLFGALSKENIVLPLKVPFTKSNGEMVIAEIGEYPFDNTLAIYGAVPDDSEIWKPTTDIAEIVKKGEGEICTTTVWTKKEEKEEEAMNVVLMLFLFTTGDASVPYFDIPVYVENTVDFREIERLAKEPCDEENYEDTVKRVLDSTSTKIWWQFFDKNANVNITGVNYILV